MMAKTLEVPTDRRTLNGVEQRILGLWENGQLPMEQVLALANVDRGEALSSISRLIADGYVELVILQDSWGIEFELRRIAK